MLEIEHSIMTIPWNKAPKINVHHKTELVLLSFYPKQFYAQKHPSSFNKRTKFSTCHGYQTTRRMKSVRTFHKIFLLKPMALEELN